MSIALAADGLTRRFGAVTAVDGVSFAIAPGETLALVGPSGSGKTTTLRMLAGFEPIDAGRVLAGGEDVSARPPAARGFGMVFQSYALFPHLDVGANIAFGLEARGIRGAEARARVASLLATVDLAGMEHRPVHALSGGQQQRVALARALAPEPRVLLLDEPLSNLDPSLRERTRRELRDLIRRTGLTTVIVTHELEEAFELGDRVALLRAGRLEQLGTPDELYAFPATTFVARFVGRATPLAARVQRPMPTAFRLAVGDVVWEVPAHRRAGLAEGAEVQLLVRPEALRLTAPGVGVLGGTVVSSRYVGGGALVSVHTAAGDVEVLHGEVVPIGERVGIVPSRRAGGSGMLVFPAGV